MDVRDRPLRGAIIGFGFIASRGHLPAYLERVRAGAQTEVTLVAVADRCTERRAAAQEALPQARIYTDHEILLEREDELDFVDIVTPPSFHAEIALAALKRGVHVLCEAPLATSTEDAQTVMEAAATHQRVLFPCHSYKHAPVVKAIAEVIASGRIGSVRSVTLNTFRDAHAKGIAEWRPDWRRERRFGGGGIAMDQGCHAFSLAFDWLGSLPTAITAKIANLEPQRFDMEDTLSATLTFPTGLAHVHLTWTAGVKKNLYSIHGTRGAITVDDDEIQIAVMRRTSGPDPDQGEVAWDTERRSIASHWREAGHARWFPSLFDSFRAAITRNDWVSPELVEASLSLRLIEAAYRSAREECREVTLTADRDLGR